MLIVDRKRKLVDLLAAQGTAQLVDLARQLGVSTGTIRRDIAQLARTGIIQKTHGGAIYRGGTGLSEPITAAQHSIELEERMYAHVHEKKAIARYAASLVKPDMTVILDGGSTVIYTASQITARPIQIITNSVAIANIFTEEGDVELIMLGGALYPRTGVVIGPITTGCLADLHADLLLFSAAGIHDDGVYNQNQEMALVEQAMMRQAARSVLLMDSSKFDRKSLTRVCAFSELEQIITDPRVPNHWYQRLLGKMVLAKP